MATLARRGIAAVVAAAGRGTRMGRPKQLLPWGDSTVIRTVVLNLQAAGANPVVVAAGYCSDEVRATLADSGAAVVTNPDYEHLEMARSFQIGLGALSRQEHLGALLALGDQPHIPVSILRQIVSAAHDTPDAVIIPSIDRRRGHPLYMPAALWHEVLALEDDDSLRNVVDRHSDEIRYLIVESDAVLRDIDTPDDYELLRPA